MTEERSFCKPEDVDALHELEESLEGMARSDQKTRERLLREKDEATPP